MSAHRPDRPDWLDSVARVPLMDAADQQAQRGQGKEYGVYMVVAGDGEAVKIGVTGCLVGKARELRNANFLDCWLARFIPVKSRRHGLFVERWLHKHFYSYRRRGEWFYPAEDMLTVMPPDKTYPIAEVWRADQRIKLGVEPDVAWQIFDKTNFDLYDSAIPTEKPGSVA